MTRSVWLLALLASVAPLAGAVAKTECKAAVTSPLVLSTDDVDNSWRTAVTNVYGAGWDDLSKAQGKRYYDVNLALAIMHYMTAQPCRNLIIINKVPSGAFKLLKSTP